MKLKKHEETTTACETRFLVVFKLGIASFSKRLERKRKVCKNYKLLSLTVQGKMYLGRKR